MKRCWICLVTLALLSGVSILLWTSSSSALGPGQWITISVVDSIEGRVLITNTGPKSVAVSISSQVLSNGTWHPLKEELFTHPSHVLKCGYQPRRRGSEEQFESMTFAFPERVSGKLPWRVVILCQKHYPESVFGQLDYVIERNVTKRAGFANRDHRGAYDEWVFSDRIETTMTEPDGAANGSQPIRSEAN